jgi:hypothetical protein
MRIATSPVQAWLSRQAIWWRGDGHPAFNWNCQPPGYGKAAETVVHLAMIWKERV